MGDREPAEVELALHELARKELVRPARTSSMEGRPSMASGTCSSGTLPTARSHAPPAPARHRAAAAWLEHQAGERAEDLADVLAHHYVSALELARRRGTSQGGGGAGGERDPLPGAGGRARARARRRPRRTEPGQGARARPSGPSRARVAARALGAGGAAAGPPPGDTSRTRGGARPLPRAGREHSRPGGR